MTENNLELAYKVAKINTTKFSYKDLDEDVVNKIFSNQEDIKVDLNVGLGISAEKSEMYFEINTSLRENGSDESIIQHTGKTTFSIKNLEKAYHKEEDKFDIPDGLIAQLYALSYSHSRALLSVELSKTIYKDKFYLPVINPTDILKK
jgi:hypothetical protein